LLGRELGSVFLHFIVTSLAIVLVVTAGRAREAPNIWVSLYSEQLFKVGIVGGDVFLFLHGLRRLGT